MPDIYQVLREKEAAIERVRREIEALRLVCRLMDSEDDTTTNASESGIEGEEKVDVISPVGERDESLARIRERLVKARESKVSGTNILLQFREVAVGTSRTLLKRVLDMRLLEREPQRKTIQNIAERLDRSNAA